MSNSLFDSFTGFASHRDINFFSSNITNSCARNPRMRYAAACSKALNPTNVDVAGVCRDSLSFVACIKRKFVYLSHSVTGRLLLLLSEIWFNFVY